MSSVIWIALCKLHTRNIAIIVPNMSTLGQKRKSDIWADEGMMDGTVYNIYFFSSSKIADIIKRHTDWKWLPSMVPHFYSVEISVTLWFLSDFYIAWFDSGSLDFNVAVPFKQTMAWVMCGALVKYVQYSYLPKCYFQLTLPECYFTNNFTWALLYN